MDTTLTINRFKRQRVYHEQQATLLLSIFNNTRAGIFLGQLPPNLSVSPLYCLVNPTDEYYSEIKDLIQKMAEYHTAKKLWYVEAIAETEIIMMGK